MMAGGEMRQGDDPPKLVPAEKLRGSCARKVLTSLPLSDQCKQPMSKQYNKEIKKRRRLARLKRKKAAQPAKK